MAESPVVLSRGPGDSLRKKNYVDYTIGKMEQKRFYICEKRRDIYKFSGASAKWVFLLSGAFSFCYLSPPYLVVSLNPKEAGSLKMTYGDLP